MAHPFRLVLLYDSPVFLAAANTTPFAPFDHDEEDSRTGQADKRSRYETILVPEVFDPRCDPIIVLDCRRSGKHVENETEGVDTHSQQQTTSYCEPR